MSLPTPSQSVSHKWFHQCVNNKKKLSLRHPLPTFCSFSFFQASIWLGVDKVLQKLTKSYKSEVRHLFQCCILIPRKCPLKTPFQHTVPPPIFLTFLLAWRWTTSCYHNKSDHTPMRKTYQYSIQSIRSINIYLHRHTFRRMIVRRKDGPIVWIGIY